MLLMSLLSADSDGAGIEVTSSSLCDAEVDVGVVRIGFWKDSSCNSARATGIWAMSEVKSFGLFVGVRLRAPPRFDVPRTHASDRCSRIQRAHGKVPVGPLVLLL